MSKYKEIKLNQEFELRLDEQAVFSLEGLIIKFLAVLEDSRCPQGVDCFWEGNGKIRISVEKFDSAINIFELNTNIDPQTIRVEDYQIKLITLLPKPKLDKEIKQDTYKIGLLIYKDQSPYLQSIPIDTIC